MTAQVHHVALDGGGVMPVAATRVMRRHSGELVAYDGERAFLVFEAGTWLAVTDSILQASRDSRDSRALVKSISKDVGLKRVGRIPSSYSLTDDGTWRMGKEVEIPVAHGPIIVTRRLENVDDGARQLQLAWLEGEQVRWLTAPREDLLTATSLQKLTRYGLPVTSNRLANELVNYISEFERDNRDLLPYSLTTRRMGWQERRELFLWGAETICAKGEPAEELQLEAGDDDATNLVTACTQSGTLAGWQWAVSEIEPHPAAVVALLTSLASGLLKPLGREGFITDLSGPTSTGKTIAAKVAASAWGQPDPKQKASIVLTWDSTRVGAERIAERRGSLPMFLDDTMMVRNPKEIEKLIYQQTAGRGRTRGHPDGLRDTPNWLSNMVSTGEQSLADYSEAGGARARVVAFHEPPFGRPSGKSKALVQQLDAGVRENYGHAGPALVRFAAEQREQWPAWRKRCAKRDAGLTGARRGQGEVDRQADYFATLYVVAELAREAGVLPFDGESSLDAAWQQVVRGASDMDKPLRAMLDVIDWLDSHPSRFRDAAPVAAEGAPRVKSAVGGAEPHGGWAGLRRTHDVGFVPAQLDEVLRDHGYQPRAVRAAWKERGWIVVRADGQTAVSTAIPGEPNQRLVLIKASVIGELRDQ